MLNRQRDVAIALWLASIVVLLPQAREIEPQRTCIFHAQLNRSQKSPVDETLHNPEPIRPCGRQPVVQAHCDPGEDRRLLENPARLRGIDEGRLPMGNRPFSAELDLIVVVRFGRRLTVEVARGASLLIAGERDRNPSGLVPVCSA